MSIWSKVESADIVITIGQDGIKTIKNRYNEVGQLDLAKVLELLLPYQKEYLHPLLNSWIDKLKVYRIFS